MKIKSTIKAGTFAGNHNQAKSLILKSAVKAGGMKMNHNQSGPAVKSALGSS